MGGRRLYCHDGRLRYWYNLAGYRHLYMDGTTAVPADHHQVRTEFAYDGGGVGNDAHGLEECASDAPSRTRATVPNCARATPARRASTDVPCCYLPQIWGLVLLPVTRHTSTHASIRVFRAER